MPLSWREVLGIKKACFSLRNTMLPFQVTILHRTSVDITGSESELDSKDLDTYFEDT